MVGSGEMVTVVTPATIARVLATARGGEQLKLVGEFGLVVISRVFSPSIIIDAGGARFAGVKISGGGVVWRGGTIRSPKGEDGNGPDYYGLWLDRAVGVSASGVRMTGANKLCVLNYARNVLLDRCLFELGGDGVIMAGGGDIEVRGSFFRRISERPTLCSIDGQQDVPGLSRRDCEARGGKWLDGWHPDAVQYRAGVDGLRIVCNVIDGVMQGVTNMEAKGDAKCRNVVIEDNDVAVSGNHSITDYGSIGVWIRRNRVRQTTGMRTVIRSAPGAVVEDNDVQRPGDPGA